MEYGMLVLDFYCYIFQEKSACACTNLKMSPVNNYCEILIESPLGHMAI
jgi:hypothetical protein